LKVLLEKSRQYTRNLEIQFSFLRSLRKGVRRSKTKAAIWHIVQERNIPNQLLTAIIKTYDNNETNMKLDATLTEPINVNKGVKQGCQLSPSLFNVHINQVIIERKERR
jgi:hypothetical protein